MDKTVEIVMVLMVALATAAIILFLIQGRSGSFNNFLDTESQGGQCELWKAQEKCYKASECSWSSSECRGTDSSNNMPQGSSDCDSGQKWCEAILACVDEDMDNRYC